MAVSSPPRPGRVLPGRHEDQEGEQLALRGSITSMIRCSSGGDNTLIYTPPLYLGGYFTPASNTDGCWLLMEAVIK